MATSIVLLFAAGLLLKTFVALTRIDPGFDARDVVTFHISPSYGRYNTEEKINALYATVTDGISVLSGVRAVGSSTQLPFVAGGWSEVITRTDRPVSGQSLADISVVFAGPGYERALGIPILSGRALAPEDNGAAERVVLINEALARREFPGENPLGHLVSFPSSKASWKIIGVIRSIHATTLYEEAPPTLIVPTLQFVRYTRYVIVRSTLPATQVLAFARSALRQIDPTIAITDAMTMEDRLGTSLPPQRFRAVLVGGLGVLALLLAVVGIFGVAAYAVTRRTREIGIRMALGEDAAQVQRRIVGVTVRTAGIGVLIGILPALALSRWMSKFLVGVDSRIHERSSALERSCWRRPHSLRTCLRGGRAVWIQYACFGLTDLASGVG